MSAVDILCDIVADNWDKNKDAGVLIIKILINLFNFEKKHQILISYIKKMTTYTYDLGITPVRSQAGGCLTTKNIV
jgi:hypothetical protein